MPKRPKPVVLHDTTTKSLHVSWELPDERGSRIDEVFVYEAIEPDEVCSLSSLRGRLIPSHTTHTVFKGFRPGTRHFFRIRCKNACGWSEDSLANAAPGFRTVPTAPEPCLPPQLGGPSLSTALSLCWAPPSYDNGEPVTAFELAILEDTRVSEWEVLGQFSVEELTPKAVSSQELGQAKRVASSSSIRFESSNNAEESKEVQRELSTDEPASAKLAQKGTADSQPEVNVRITARHPKEVTRDQRSNVSGTESSNCGTTSSQAEVDKGDDSKQEPPHTSGALSANRKSEAEAVVAKAFMRAVAKLPTKQLRKRLSASLMVPDDEQGHGMVDLQGVDPSKGMESAHAANTTERNIAEGNTQAKEQKLTLDVVQRMLRAEIVAHLLEIHLKEYRAGVMLGDDATVSGASAGALNDSRSQPTFDNKTIGDDKTDSSDSTSEQRINQSDTALKKQLDEPNEVSNVVGSVSSLQSNVAEHCAQRFFKTVENLRYIHHFENKVRAIGEFVEPSWLSQGAPTINF